MKLNKFEKTERKDMMEHVAAQHGIVLRFGRVTFVAVPTCKMGWNVSWAVCSANDKNRRKYGELIALQRMGHGQHLPMQVDPSLTYIFAVLFDMSELIAPEQ